MAEDREMGHLLRVLATKVILTWERERTNSYRFSSVFYLRAMLPSTHIHKA